MKKTVKIHVLHCGYLRISKDLLDNEGRFSTDITRSMITPNGHRVTLPVSAYLIEHPAGLYLVDTGWSKDPDLPRHLTALYHPDVPDGMTVVEQLDARGLKPENLTAVLITHLDADHVDGLISVSNAQRIIIPEDEAYWSVRTKYRMRQVRKLWETVRYERMFYRGYQLGPMNRAIDITGDESIMMVSLPGHTDGQAGIIIKNGSKYVLLAADAAISPRNWEEMKAAGLGAEKGLQLKTLSWIAKTADDPDCVKVLCSHDPGVVHGATYEL
jgi:glyoxylase-like metal-dependent hydrolase (beta-lactamase superfamily II)